MTINCERCNHPIAIEFDLNDLGDYQNRKKTIVCSNCTMFLHVSAMGQGYMKAIQIWFEKSQAEVLWK